MMACVGYDSLIRIFTGWEPFSVPVANLKHVQIHTNTHQEILASGREGKGGRAWILANREGILSLSRYMEKL